MGYTNDKIKKLIAEKKAIVERYDREIQNEIDKEKARYKFSWKRFLLMIAAIALMVTFFELNKRLFPKTSIWSWDYYLDHTSTSPDTKSNK